MHPYSYLYRGPWVVGLGTSAQGGIADLCAQLSPLTFSIEGIGRANAASGVYEGADR